MLDMHSTRCEFFKQHWRLFFPTADKRTSSCALRGKKSCSYLFFQMKNLTLH